MEKWSGKNEGTEKGKERGMPRVTTIIVIAIRYDITCTYKCDISFSIVLQPTRHISSNVSIYLLNQYLITRTL